MSSTVMDSRKRRGLLGEKVGMTQVWTEGGRVVPVTVVQTGPNVVTQVRTADKDGYSAIQLGFGQVKPRKVTKPMGGHFEKAGVTPRRSLVELRTVDASEFELGQEINADVFEAGQRVDITGTSKGKGFAGVMKRHGFHGQRASHGAHKVHRAPGSIGGCATPGRVFKGVAMPGRMGNAKVTVQGVRVQAIDLEKGLILLEGAVPGPRGSLVLIRTGAKEAEQQ